MSYECRKLTQTIMIFLRTSCLQSKQNTNYHDGNDVEDLVWEDINDIDHHHHHHVWWWEILLPWRWSWRWWWWCRGGWCLGWWWWSGVRGLWTLVPAARQEGRRPLREFNCQKFLQPQNMFLRLSIIWQWNENSALMQATHKAHQIRDICFRICSISILFFPGHPLFPSKFL